MHGRAASMGRTWLMPLTPRPRRAFRQFQPTAIPSAVTVGPPLCPPEIVPSYLIHGPLESRTLPAFLPPLDVGVRPNSFPTGKPRAKITCVGRNGASSSWSTGMSPMKGVPETSSRGTRNTAASITPPMVNA